MEDLESKSNQEILFEIKKMEIDYEAAKLKALKAYDEMVELEEKFDKATIILNQRLKG